MDFLYTFHAEEKLLDRKFSKMTIEETVRNPGRLLSSRFGRKIAERIVNGKLLRVIYEKQDSLYIIITAYYTELNRYGETDESNI